MIGTHILMEYIPNIVQIVSVDYETVFVVPMDFVRYAQYFNLALDGSKEVRYSQKFLFKKGALYFQSLFL